MTRRAIVVGAGFGGLATACHLAGSGWDVEVVERLDQPGGRAGRLERNGFRFDTGPTVLTMPDLLRATFSAAGADMDDHLALTRLDPAYRAAFADGSELRIRADRAEMAAEVARVCGPGEAERFDRYCDWLGRLCRLEMPAFLDRNYDHVTDLARPLGPALQLLRLGALRRLDRVVARAFRDDRLRRLFSFQALYAGVAPQRALGVLAVIGYMDVVAGVWAARGGMHAVATGLADAVVKAGGRIRYGTAADEVVLADGDRGPVRGVRIGGELVAADAVVVNADLPGAYGLLPGLRPPARLRRARYSPSAAVWHVGTRGRPAAGTAHHNIHFGRAWHGAFDALDDGRRMPDPSLLVSVPTLSDPELAPPGSSVLYVLEPVPNLTGALDWSRVRGAVRGDLAARVDRLGYPVDVVEEALVDPVDWARQGLAAGTPFSLSHTFSQSGPLRPSNVDRRAPGLVFVGTGTVPGVGVPMVLLSGKLAAERLGPGA
ncbi:MAG TPA: phytoene desaturase family protein [Acidimicrobiales bacterium]|nr:phytoene desaturase family protein [Acidimicrobiales bacterium]